MKNIICHLAQTAPGMDAGRFEALYLAEYPKEVELTPDNIRQAFASYNKYCRKFRKGTKAKKQ